MQLGHYISCQCSISDGIGEIDDDVIGGLMLPSADERQAKKTLLQDDEPASPAFLASVLGKAPRSLTEDGLIGTLGVRDGSPERVA